MSIDLLNLSGRRRLPLIRQAEAAECGLACLAMIAGYHGLVTDLPALRRRFSIGLQGTTLRGLMDIAKGLGLAARPLKVPLEQVGGIAVPAIIHWDLNHFVVLKAVRRGKYIVHDPALGERVYTAGDFSGHFTGIALELTPAGDFRKRDERTKLALSDLWGRIVGLKRSVAHVLLLSVILQVFVLVSPFFLQITVDEVLAKFDADLLLVLALGFAGLTIIDFTAQILRGYVLLHFGSHLSFQMTGNLFRHLLHLPIDFFEKRHIGDIISRFGSMEPLKAMLTEGLIAAVIDGIMAVTTLILMFVYSPLLSFIVLAALGLYFLLRLSVYRPLREAQEDALVEKARESTAFIETVRGMASVKLFGAEQEREILWQNRFAAAINAEARKARLSVWFKSANAGIFGLEHIVLIYAASKMAMAGGFSVGMIFAFLAYKVSFRDRASALVEKLIDYRMLDLHLERIADIAQAEREEAEGEEPGQTRVGFNPAVLSGDSAPLTGALALRDVRYRYSDATPEILRGVSLSIAPGEHVAIIGASGCGKTTLLKIMTGLFRPTGGEVLLDGVPVGRYGLSHFRRQIGVMMQEDTLFAGSIAENIAFFDPAADMAWIVACARMAAVHDEIAAMPMGYESLAGDMGSTLSGGQKQRVMLARALYRRPKILFMDEGTAHLDVATERLVGQSIASLGITRILIAHRPETIRMADRVLEMSGGVLREVSTSSPAPDLVIA